MIIKPAKLMKRTIFFAVAFAVGSLCASAQLTIPSDGSDGALNVTEDTVIDLSQAVTGTWDQNNSANAGKGIYDPEKWAVVFKYASVNIAGSTSGTPAQLVGRTVRFKNHPSKAPVVWLVQGGVEIMGRLILSGQDGNTDAITSLLPAEPGPGGFRGGAKGPLGYGSGYGPGGLNSDFYGAPGLFASSYGNPQIIPLLGGSGSAPGHNRSGGGGGGGILIAAGTDIIVTGKIECDGGVGVATWSQASGGAIRLIARNVLGRADLGAGVSQNLTALPGGRIRIEANMAPTLVTAPETVGVAPSDPPIIWPAANAPKARVLSVDNVSAPADPTSPLVAAADVAIQNNAPVNIVVETRDFPIEGTVQLAVIPKFGARTWLPATRISGDINVATWRVTTTLPQGFVTLQARATQP